MGLFFVYGPIFVKFYIWVVLPTAITKRFSDFENSKIWGSCAPPNVRNAHCLQTELFRNICQSYRLEILWGYSLSIGPHGKTPKVGIFNLWGLENHPKMGKIAFFAVPLLLFPWKKVCTLQISKCTNFYSKDSLRIEKYKISNFQNFRGANNPPNTHFV
jgi:hypothetical protein